MGDTIIINTSWLILKNLFLVCVDACAPTTRVCCKNYLFPTVHRNTRESLLRTVILINIFQLFLEENLRPLAVNTCLSSWGKCMLLLRTLSIITLFRINLYAHAQTLDRLVISLPSQSCA